MTNTCVAVPISSRGSLRCRASPCKLRNDVRIAGPILKEAERIVMGPRPVGAMPMGDCTTVAWSDRTEEHPGPNLFPQLTA